MHPPAYLSWQESCVNLTPETDVDAILAAKVEGGCIRMKEINDMN